MAKDRTNEDADDAVRRLERDLAPDLSGEAAGVVHHYTSLDALLGILAEGAPRLRASDLRFLNDTSEREYGRRLYEAAMEEKSSHPAYRILRDALDVCGAEYEADTVTLVAALSEARDSLSQWRGYGRDEAGAAIGFVVGGLDGGATAHRVLYGDAAGRNVLRRFVDAALEAAARGAEGFTFRALARIRNKMTALMKHEAFADERELRVYRDAPLRSCAFRCDGRFLIPYQDIPIGRGALREVVLAPGPHAEARAASVRLYLRRLDYDAPVRLSEVPFRP